MASAPACACRLRLPSCGTLRRGCTAAARSGCGARGRAAGGRLACAARVGPCVFGFHGAAAALPPRLHRRREAHDRGARDRRGRGGTGRRGVLRRTPRVDVEYRRSPASTTCSCASRQTAASAAVRSRARARAPTGDLRRGWGGGGVAAAAAASPPRAACALARTHRGRIEETLRRPRRCELLRRAVHPRPGEEAQGARAARVCGAPPTRATLTRAGACAGRRRDVLVLCRWRQGPHAGARARARVRCVARARNLAGAHARPRACSSPVT